MFTEKFIFRHLNNSEDLLNEKRKNFVIATSGATKQSRTFTVAHHGITAPQCLRADNRKDEYENEIKLKA
ncbi:MAG: hypothetical protein PHT44_04625 [Candidatus Portnoybacteria bacterium]|nr:hypothetical protein [Candidatus Portnoybacteria bacterium]MDD4983202.1 hypothetical protein [Candidatus Portnoybacteria bacterium]